jgi:hypothetical protein
VSNSGSTYPYLAPLYAPNKAANLISERWLDCLFQLCYLPRRLMKREKYLNKMAKVRKGTV